MTPLVNPLAVNPVEPFLRSDRMPHIWCPGCGIGTTVNCFARALIESKIDLKTLALVSGIGCTGRVAGYVKLDSFHTTHGRAIPFATGMKLANPKLEVASDTLTGTLDYAGQRVATATMVYKHENHSRDPQKTVDALQKLQVLLKLIPDADGSPKIVQLVGLNITEVTVKGSWTGPARLHLIPHVNAPVADLPVRKVLGGLGAA